MTKARKLLHTRYRVNDLEKTVKFYKEVLGLEEIRRHKSPRGSELVFMKTPESEELIELCYFPASGPVQVQADLTHLAFEVESLDAFLIPFWGVNESEAAAIGFHNWTIGITNAH